MPYAWEAAEGFLAREERRWVLQSERGRVPCVEKVWAGMEERG